MGMVALWNADNDPDYDLNYGNNCSFPWDNVTAACVEGGSSYGADWCGNPWCYVPGHCPGATSTQFFANYTAADQSIYYSYAHCDSEDTFTNGTETTVTAGSYVDSSSIVVSSIINASDIINSTIINSTMAHSTIINSTMAHSRATGALVVQSEAGNSTLEGSTLFESVVVASIVTECTLENSTVWESTLVNVTLIDATVIGYSLHDVVVQDELLIACELLGLGSPPSAIK
eukprot:gene10116-11974_t